MKKIKYWMQAVADIMLPRHCVVCGRVLGIKENHLCIYCMADFPFTFFWKRSRNPMSKRLNELISTKLSQNTYTEAYEPYSHAISLFYYSTESPYKHITRQLKYHQNTRIGLDYGAILGEKINECDFLHDADLIIPVPLHWTRKWTRGYNQSAIIATGVSQQTQIPVNEKILYRNRKTLTQTKLRKEEKIQNVNTAFSINRKYASEIHPSHILLIDDVFTTGATIQSCHSALREFYGKKIKISAATLGFAGNP